MIGKVSGRVDYVAEDHALIEAQGVGYIVYASPRALAALAPGEAAAFYTELVVREDLMQLYGFPTLAEKEWHRLLTSVQGVGAKVALAILGALGPEATSRAIALGDASAIRRAPGVGPKLAQRIANELKDKAPAVMALGAGGAKAAMPSQGEGARATPAPAGSPQMAAAAGAAPPPEGGADPQAPDPQAQADALSALTNLGWSVSEAASAVAEAAAADPGADAKALIRAALKALAPEPR
ncbi:MAG: Holliday junction branch migration protein RuvA [Pseudomonadota bacterium]